MMILLYLAKWVFWTCGFLIAYTYSLYPVVLFLCYALVQLRRDCRYLMNRQDRRTRDFDSDALPCVSFVIAAYNEEESLPAKLENLRSLDYPTDRIEIIFVSDASTDRTNEILADAGNEQFRVIIQPERGGKPAALNCAIAAAKHEILMLSDVSTLFAPDAVRRLVRHFCDPRVGAVCGALRFQASGESQQTEGVYWRYESILRLMEARLGATLTASGAIYALRRSAFVPFAPGTLIDDIVAPMNARKLGLQVIYDPEALATDVAAASVAGEFRRRVRIAVGSFRALGQLSRVRMPGFTLFAFLSHKVLRWLVPLFAVMLLVSNLFLLRSTLYAIALIAQGAFLGWAAVGFLWRERLRRVRFALLGYFLFAMNIAFLIGFVQAFRTRKEGTWQRVS
jgi:cellulose synthase/poly-beta-1,6-N-acetylglucosamine synthase-like glycosyltransferase